jgi:parallel beta-helix repeat protein
MPYTKKAADSVRPRASRSVLTAVRAPSGKPIQKAGSPKASTIGYIAGAGANASAPPAIPSDAIIVSPGGSIQQALDSAVTTNGKWGVVKAGIHTFPAVLKMHSGTTLMGEGAATILFLDPASGQREAMINADPDLHDVTIRDLVIEGGNKTDPGTDPNANRSFKGGYNRGGILFRAEKEGGMQHIDLIDITIRNSTYSGISISGASNITITSCDLTENGASVPPGPKLTHNLLLAHCTGVNITGSRLVTSPSGCGISLDHCSNVFIANCEIARNGYFGVLLAESKNVSVKGSLIEANDRSGVLAEFLFNGNEHITISGNRIQYNNGYGVETYAAGNSKIEDNKYEGNGKSQQKLSPEKFVLLDRSL